MALKGGDYVRVLGSLKTIHGTIKGCGRDERGFVQYLFHPDLRNCSEPVRDFYVSEGEVELRERPSDKLEKETKGDGRQR